MDRLTAWHIYSGMMQPRVSAAALGVPQKNPRYAGTLWQSSLPPNSLNNTSDSRAPHTSHSCRTFIALTGVNVECAYHPHNLVLDAPLHASLSLYHHIGLYVSGASSSGSELCPLCLGQTFPRLPAFLTKLIEHDAGNYPSVDLSSELVVCF
jgi:hypothetical protein